VNLKRAIELKARIISVKYLPSGHPVSYSRTYTTDKKKKVGVVAFGYADGLTKALSNLGCLYWKDKPIKILGNITMDMTIVDLDNTSAQVGDWVEIVGNTKVLVSSLSLREPSLTRLCAMYLPA
jgi:alanine racemase